MVSKLLVNSRQMFWIPNDVGFYVCNFYVDQWWQTCLVVDMRMLIEKYSYWNASVHVSTSVPERTSPLTVQHDTVQNSPAKVWFPDLQWKARGPWFQMVPDASLHGGSPRVEIPSWRLLCYQHRAVVRNLLSVLHRTYTIIYKHIIDICYIQYSGIIKI